MYKWKYKKLHILLLIIITFIVYWNSLQNKFVWDSITLIRTNPFIRSLSNIPDMFNPFNKHYGTGILKQYRPMRTLTFAIDYFFYGYNPAGYHLTNVLVHIINVILSYLFITKILKFNSNISFFISLIFAVHPINTSNINYVKNRTELLSGLFFFITVLVYFKSYRDSGADKRSILLYYFLSIITTAFAVLSKQNTLIIPSILLLLHIYVEQVSIANLKKWLLRIIPHTIIILIIVLFQLLRVYQPQIVLTEISEKLSSGYGLSNQSITTIIYTMSLIIIKYIQLLLFPYQLVVDYWHSIERTISFQIILYFSGILGILILSIRSIIKREKWGFFVIWFFIGLIPYSNIIKPLPRMISESYLYLPSLGIYITVVLLITSFFNAKISPRTRHLIGQTGLGRNDRMSKFIYLFFILIVIILSARTIIRNEDFQTPEIFWQKHIETCPGPRAYHNLGFIYDQKGQYQKALAHFQKAYQLDNSYFYSTRALAKMYARKKNYKKAIFFIAEYERYVKYIPVNTLILFGDIYRYNGNIQKARYYYHQAELQRTK